MNLHHEKRLSDDRRRCEDRRQSGSSSNLQAFERRLDMQRRVLNIDALSVGDWLADHQSKGSLSRQINMTSQQ